MVTFFANRMPAQKGEYVVAADREGSKLLLKAEPEKIRDSVSYWFDSDKPLRFLSAGDIMKASVAEKGNIYLTRANLGTSPGILGKRDENTYDNVAQAMVQQKEAGALLGITADFPDELQEVSVTDEVYNNEALENSAIDWVERNKDRVTLGYGPEHPLDDIEPLAVSSDYIPRQDKSIVDNFNEWLRVAVETTAISSNEHAFYLDENNNVVGMISGGRTSVTYPSSRPGKVKMSAHTHPTIKSLAFPSETDLTSHSFRCTEDSVEMIALGNSHTNFIFNRDIEESNRPNQAAANYPFDETPILLLSHDGAETVEEVRQHHSDQYDKIRVMLDQQLQHKRRGIDSVKSEISDAAFDYLESEFEKAAMLRDKLIEEDKAVQSLNDIGEEEGIKFTLSQEPLQL